MKLKLRNPELEQRLQQRLAQASPEALLPRSFDLYARSKTVVFKILVEGLISYLFILLLGYKSPQWVGTGGQAMVVGFWFLSSAAIIRGMLAQRSFQDHSSQVLWMLPVPGQWILQRARLHTLLGTWPVLLRAHLAAWALSGFPELFAGTITSREVAAMLVPAWGLWIITLAMAGAEQDAWIERVRLPVLWRGLAFLGKIIMVALYLTLERRISWLPVREYLEGVSSVLVWVLPPAWMAALVQGNNALGPLPLFAMLATVLTLIGVRMWQWWPEQAAPAFDTLPRGLEAGDEDDEITPQDETDHTEPSGDLPQETSASWKGAASEAAPTPAQVAKALREPAHWQGPKPGWIERAFWYWLTPSQRAILPVVVRPAQSWTAAWQQVCLWVAGLLVVAFVCQAVHFRVPSLSEQALALRTFAFIAMGLLILFRVFPASGGVSAAVWPAPGHLLHGVPMLASVPVLLQDLLRISMKLAFLRAVATFTVALPGVMVFGYIQGRLPGVGIACDLLVRFLALIVVVRPFLLIYRIGTATKSTRRGWWIRLCTMVILTAIFVFCMLLGTAFFCFGSIQDSPEVRLGSAALLLPLAGLSWFSFWLYRRLVRSRTLDWTV